MNLRYLRLFLSLLAMVTGAHAQLATSLKLSKTQYVAGEPVVAVVTITNHAGRELTFHGDARTPWLDFLIRSSQGRPVTPIAQNSFGAMKIAAGQTMSRQVDLSSLFRLSEPGGYSVAAVIRMPGEVQEATTTNRVSFNLSPGRVYWSQKIGVAGKPGETREYRVLNFSGNQKSQLYVQVVNDRNGMALRTFPIGDTLTLRKPTITVDGQQRLHVMFLATPTMWVHTQVDIDGKVVQRDIHQRGPSGDPKLLSFADGSVRVSNSIPYDPAAVAAARAKIRKISERPDFVYQ